MTLKELTSREEVEREREQKRGQTSREVEKVKIKETVTKANKSHKEGCTMIADAALNRLIDTRTHYCK